MRKRMGSRALAVAVAAGTSLAFVSGAAQARVTVQRPSAVPFAWTCASPDLCLYSNENGTGDSISYPTASNHGRWESTTVGGTHAGSLYDNSQSIVYIDDKQADAEQCLNPGAWDLYHDYGYFWIEYGVHSCNGSTVPPPP